MTRANSAANVSSEPEQVNSADADVRRCWGCRRLWPRSSMRWGKATEGPLWYGRSYKVLRCPDCLD